MALTHVLVFCLGLTMLVKQGEAQPSLSATTLTVNDAIAAGALGTLTATGTPTSVSLSGLPMDGMITAAINTNVDYTLVAGFTLNYESGTTSFTFNTILVDGSSNTATVTTTLSITDVADEYSDTLMYTCISGTSAIAAGTTLSTQTITSGTGTAYTISSQSPSLSLVTVASTTGVISVASGKTIDPKYLRSLTLVLSSTTTATSVTSTSSLTIYFGTCSSTSGAAPAVIGSITLLLAALVAMLQ